MAGYRSIPACTGQPIVRNAGESDAEVYPRVYGATGYSVERQPDGSGLSPRVRGNPTHAKTEMRALRSIPACTGQPDGLSA